jgi:hypothetical protein
MRFVRFIRRHPIALLGVFAVAFIVWLWRDSLPIAQPNDTVSSEPPEAAPQFFAVEAPVPRRLPPPPGVEGKGKPAPQALSKLKPGMTRAEVEELVGAPAPQDIHPVTVADGRVTYKTAYEADFGPPATVRPIIPHQHVKARTPPTKERAIVTLEYDATKPGHPLLGIHYPDNTF